MLLTFIKIISASALLIPVFRLFYSISKKTELEIILTPKLRRIWEELIELIGLTFIVALTLCSFSFMDMNQTVANHIKGFFDWDIVIFFTTFVLLVISWVASEIVGLLKDSKKPTIKKGGKVSKSVTILILINYLSIAAMFFLMISYFKHHLIVQYTSRNYFYLVGPCIIIYLIIFIQFQVYGYLYRLFNYIKLAKYKMEKLEESTIEEHLNQLFFIFPIDDNRYVLSEKPYTKKELKLPAYVYYPKENLLFRYIKVDIPYLIKK